MSNELRISKYNPSEADNCYQFYRILNVYPFKIPDVDQEKELHPQWNAIKKQLLKIYI